MMFLNLEEIELHNPIDFLGAGVLLASTNLNLFLSLSLSRALAPSLVHGIHKNVSVTFS